jgi:hypothetical protein
LLLIGDIKNFGTVWYNPKSLANIFSLAAVRKLCRITMDSNVEPALCVHLANGSVMKFSEYKTGLYYHDAAAAAPKTNVAPVIDYSFVTTVVDSKKRFTRREIEGANKARELSKKIGRPSQQQFEKILIKILIRNCPVTVDDAKRALLTYGPDVAALKGHTTKVPSKHVPTFNPVELPDSILQHPRDVTLCMDIFTSNGIYFFTRSLAKFNSAPLHLCLTGRKILFYEKPEPSWLFTSPEVSTSPTFTPTWNSDASATTYFPRD